MAYPHDARFRAQTLELLGSVWSKLPRGIAHAREWGSDWFERSQPFVAIEQGEIVAHVGVVELELILDGKRRTLAGLHAVCTREDRRGRGHLRETMRRALAWVDERWPTAVLWANEPAIYTRFGFAARAESTFHAPTPTTARSEARQLSLANGDDLALVRARLAERAPISSRCAAVEPGWLALMNLALWPAPAPSLALVGDCVVVYELRGRALRLYDVIGRALPALDELAFAPGLEAAELFFSPERLAPEARPAPSALGDFLMVRGPFLERDAPFALSPLSRC